MKKIIGVFKPFELNQHFYVYEDGNKLEIADAKIENLNDILFGLIEKYNITNVELLGPRKYLAGIKRQIKSAEMLKYNKDLIDVKII